MTDADRPSQTRFGVRPVPEGHRTAAPYAHRQMRSSAIPPSGKVSPDGRRPWPQPSTTAKAAVWGGVVLGAAGFAAGTVMILRAVTGDGESSRRASGQQSWRSDEPAVLAPRYAGLDDDEREAMRRRVRTQAREDAETKAALRVRAGRGRKSRGNFAKDLTETANELSTGLNNVAASLVGAFESFRMVAIQARGIVGEFTTAADEFRGMLQHRDTSAGLRGVGARTGDAHMDAARKETGRAKAGRAEAGHTEPARTATGQPGMDAARHSPATDR